MLDRDDGHRLGVRTLTALLESVLLDARPDVAAALSKWLDTYAEVARRQALNASLPPSPRRPSASGQTRVPEVQAPNSSTTLTEVPPVPPRRPPR